MNTIEDTGARRRLIDMHSKNSSLELLATLAYEKALAGGDEAVIESVERAILTLRQEVS